MATLVFSAVGTMAAGPIGGAIGSLVGSQFDAALFGTPGRQGPRLKELQATTSSYGLPIPHHFGHMRVAGQMIWAAPLVEHDDVMGGGKGAGTVTAYSYTASFAVAVASRPILGIGRIWADGKLLRGEAGDLKTTGTLRIHDGRGDAACDPLMLAAEGERCPAHRDLAYVVFEDLDLSPFYNHIPALTFEVIADDLADGGIGLSHILGEAIDAFEGDVALDGLRGLSSEGSLADTLDMLEAVYPLDADCAGDELVVARRHLQSAPIAIGEPAMAGEDDAFGVTAGYVRRRMPRPEQRVAALRYFDPARDYLPGIQYASGQAPTGSPRVIELPASLDAPEARALVEGLSRRLDWSRDTMSWRTCDLDPRVAPGALVAFDGFAGTWRVRAWEWREAGIEIEVERVPPAGAIAPPALAASAGRHHAQPDLPQPASCLVAFELPYDPGNGGSDRTRAFAAVSAAESQWAGAALYAEKGDGELHPLGPSGRVRSILGTTLNALAPAGPFLFDRAARLRVLLVDPAMQLAPASAQQLADGANAALVGEELIQFAEARALGAGAWELSGLQRGCAGTEAGAFAHLAGEDFVLLDNAITGLDPAILGDSPERRVIAIGRGDADGVAAPVRLAGITLRPLAPVHPRRTVLADGTWRLGWTRRARGLWPWLDGVEVPLVEEREAYLASFGEGASPLALWTLDVPWLELSAARRAELDAMAPGARLRVAQQGTHALSLPLDLGPLA